jgi:hypothetical protein
LSFVFVVFPLGIGIVIDFYVGALRKRYYKKLPERGVGAEYAFTGQDMAIDRRYRRLLRVNGALMILVVGYLIFVFLPFGGI